MLAVVDTRRGSGVEAVRSYSKFLDSINEKEINKLLELFDLSLLLPTPVLADKYLAAIRKLPGTQQISRVKNAEKKLIYGGASSSDFSGSKTGELRKYYIIYLLSHGKIRELLMLPTPRDVFPEFWKIYLMRRKNYTSWKQNAELFLRKKQWKADPAALIITQVWLESISLEDAEKKINTVPYESRGLLYALIAEEYARMKKFTKADIRFRKALHSPKGIYIGVVKYIRKISAKR